MNWKTQYYKEDFKSAITASYSVIIGHLMMVPFFYQLDIPNFLANPRIQLIGITILLIFLCLKTYNWKKRDINIGIISLYAIALFFEIGYLGFPNTGLESSNKITKGIFFDMLVSLAPFLYVGLRAALILPIFSIEYQRRKLEKSLHVKIDLG